MMTQQRQPPMIDASHGLLLLNHQVLITLPYHSETIGHVEPFLIELTMSHHTTDIN